MLTPNQKNLSDTKLIIEIFEHFNKAYKTAWYNGRSYIRHCYVIEHQCYTYLRGEIIPRIGASSITFIEETHLSYNDKIEKSKLVELCFNINTSLPNRLIHNVRKAYTNDIFNSISNSIP